MAILAMPEHGHDARGTKSARRDESRPGFVGAGLALPPFSAASGTDKLQGQGKPCPYETAKSHHEFAAPMPHKKREQVAAIFSVHSVADDLDATCKYRAP